MPFILRASSTSAPFSNPGCAPRVHTPDCAVVGYFSDRGDALRHRNWCHELRVDVIQSLWLGCRITIDPRDIGCLYDCTWADCGDFGTGHRGTIDGGVIVDLWHKLWIIDTRRKHRWDLVQWPCVSARCRFGRVTHRHLTSRYPRQWELDVMREVRLLDLAGKQLHGELEGIRPHGWPRSRRDAG